MTMTPRLHSERIVFCRTQLELLEKVQIPDLRAARMRCILEGRLASSCGYAALIDDLLRDAEAYRRSIDFHLTEIAGGE